MINNNLDIYTACKSLHDGHNGDDNDEGDWRTV